MRCLDNKMQEVRVREEDGILGRGSAQSPEIGSRPEGVAISGQRVAEKNMQFVGHAQESHLNLRLL